MHLTPNARHQRDADLLRRLAEAAMQNRPVSKETYEQLVDSFFREHLDLFICEDCGGFTEAFPALIEIAMLTKVAPKELDTSVAGDIANRIIGMVEGTRH